MGHRILSQGVLDGTCFLYTIMNAYKTLVYPEIDNEDFMHLGLKEKSGLKKWEHIVRTCPQIQDLLVGNGFHVYISSIMTLNPMGIIDNQYKNTLITSFDILSDSDYVFEVQNIELDDVRATDFSDSVIILSIEKNIDTYSGNKIGNHIICINGITGSNLHIMCSYSIHQLPNGNYIEKFDEKYKRYYNNIISLDNITKETIGMGINGIFKITRHT